MRRIAPWLGLLALTVACRGESGWRNPFAKTSTAVADPRRSLAAAPAPKTADIAELEAKHGQPLRISHRHAIGEVRGHRWSEDERLLAVWSETAVIVFEARTRREVLRTRSAAGSQLASAGLSPDGHWAIVASRALDALPLTLELYALGESVPRRRWLAAPGNGESWQIGRDSRTIAWLQASGIQKTSPLQLHVEKLETGATVHTVDLPDPEGKGAQGMQQGSTGRILLVQLVGHSSVVDLEQGRAWHHPSITDPVLAPSGDAAIWANEDGFILWSLGRERTRTLSDPRCAPHHWPERAAARALFAEHQPVVATSGMNGVCLWDLDTGRLRNVLRRPGQGHQEDFLKEPSRWVYGDKGLITNGTELWDVAHRRLVRAGFSEYSKRGGQPLLLQVPDQKDSPTKLFTVDEQLRVHEVAQQSCSLDVDGGWPIVIGFERAAAIACEPGPWIVDWRRGTSRRLEQPVHARLAASPANGWLTMTPRQGFALTDPDQPESVQWLVRDLGWVSLKGFDGQRLWMAHSPEWQRFDWTSLDLGRTVNSRLASGTVTQRCGNRDSYLVGAHYQWSNSDQGSLALCDLTTAREVGSLENVPGARVLALNADATLAHIGGPRARQAFWFIGEHRTANLDLDLHPSCFAGPDTVVGVADGKVTIANPRTGSKTAQWELSMLNGESLLAADLASDLVLVGSKRPTLRRLSDGKVMAQLPVPELRSAVFGTNLRLFASDNQRIWFWQLPATSVAGELVLDSGAVMYAAANGSFETSSPVTTWQQSLICAVGPEVLAPEICIKHLYDPGLIERVLSLPGDSDQAASSPHSQDRNKVLLVPRSQ